MRGKKTCKTNCPNEREFQDRSRSILCRSRVNALTLFEVYVLDWPVGLVVRDPDPISLLSLCVCF